MPFGLIAGMTETRSDILLRAVLEGASPGLGTGLDVELDASILAKVVDGSGSRGSSSAGSSRGRLGRGFRHVDGVGCECDVCGVWRLCGVVCGWWQTPPNKQ